MRLGIHSALGRHRRSHPVQGHQTLLHELPVLGAQPLLLSLPGRLVGVLLLHLLDPGVVFPQVRVVDKTADFDVGGWRQLVVQFELVCFGFIIGSNILHPLPRVNELKIVRTLVFEIVTAVLIMGDHIAFPVQVSRGALVKPRWRCQFGRVYRLCLEPECALRPQIIDCLLCEVDSLVVHAIVLTDFLELLIVAHRVPAELLRWVLFLGPTVLESVHVEACIGPIVVSLDIESLAVWFVFQK